MKSDKVFKKTITILKIPQIVYVLTMPFKPYLYINYNKKCSLQKTRNAQIHNRLHKDYSYTG